MSKMSSEALRVLIGIDNSDNSENAFDYYMKHMYRPDWELILLHVTEIPQSIFMTNTAYDEVVREETSRSEAVQKEFKKKLDSLGVSGRIVVTLANKPGETIVETAQSEKASLVVVGSRGQGKLRRTILGSVSDYVLRHAPCAVVVCRHEHEQHPHHHRHHHFSSLHGHHSGHGGKDKDRQQAQGAESKQADRK